MKITTNLTVTNFETQVDEFAVVGICLKDSCRGRVSTTTRDGIGWCEKCGEDYEVSFITVLKVAK